MDDLIDTVRIDGKHSFEDTIMPITEVYKCYGNRIAVLGGLDVNFLCRAEEETIRRQVRETLDVCMQGKGYCLGTVNKILACRTPILGCHVYICPQCGETRLVSHSCKCLFCPTCGKHATDLSADGVLDRLLPVSYHHLVLI